MYDKQVVLHAVVNIENLMKNDQVVDNICPEINHASIRLH